MKISLYYLFLCLFSCESEVVPPPPEAAPTIGLSIEDTGVAEVWLRVSIPETVSERTFALHRDGTPIDTAMLITADSVYLDDGLLPKRQYVYQAFRTSDSVAVDSTESVQASTMDTTGHEFTWEAFQFGDYSSSVLYDVAIIDEDNIWVVGEIFLNDSTGQRDPDSYNMIRWDGKTWEASKIEFPICDGSGNEQGTSSIAAISIMAISESDVWVASRVSLVHWDGVEFNRICMPLGYGQRDITTLWGRDGVIYWGGTNGYLAYNRGAGWQQMSTGTTLNVYDIWGDIDSLTGEEITMCIASNIFKNEGQDLLRINGTNVESQPDIGLPWALSTIWFKANRRYYIGGDGLFISRTVGPTWVRDPTLPTYYMTSIRGTGLNDVVVAGSFGLMLHYNGYTWRNFQGMMPTGSFGCAAMRTNTIVAAGGNGSEAILVIGRRP